MFHRLRSRARAAWPSFPRPPPQSIPPPSPSLPRPAPILPPFLPARTVLFFLLPCSNGRGPAPWIHRRLRIPSSAHPGEERARGQPPQTEDGVLTCTVGAAAADVPPSAATGSAAGCAIFLSCCSHPCCADFVLCCADVDYAATAKEQNGEPYPQIFHLK